MIKNLLKTISLWLGLLMLIITCLYVLDKVFKIELNEFIVHLIIDMSLMFVICSYFIYSKHNILRAFKKIKTNDFFISTAIAALFSIVIGYYNYSYLISSFQRQAFFFPMNIDFSRFNNLSQYEIIRFLILMPILEEFFYRYILQNQLSKSLHFSIAIIISSILFSVLHFDFYNFLGIFLAGIYLGSIYHKTKNVLLSIYTHALFNFLVIINADSERSINSYLGLIVIVVVNLLIIQLVKKLKIDRS